MTGVTTYGLARRYGNGAFLSNSKGECWEVSDYSPGTKTAYGWPINQGNHKGRGVYGRLPEGLKPSELVKGMRA